MHSISGRHVGIHSSAWFRTEEKGASPCDIVAAETRHMSSIRPSAVRILSLQIRSRPLICIRDMNMQIDEKPRENGAWC